MGMNETTAQERPTLLIIDDEAGPRESLRIVFKDRYDCTIATSGRDGIEYARTHPIDAAILDIKMPDISGVEVLRQIKEIDPNIECVMLTGFETIETARAAVRYGAADYLSKPFDVFAVRELLEKCLARRQNKRDAEKSLQALRQMNEELGHELSQNKRAVTASVLSAGVVHELNSPLAIIAGYTELLGRDLSKIQGNDANSAKIQQRLATILQEIDRCKTITRRFLSFARTSQGEKQDIEVAKLIEDAASLVKAHPANRCAEISHAADPALHLIGPTADYLQIFINLGVNALHAMDGKGKLHFAAERVTEVPGDCQFVAKTFNKLVPAVKISVADTGCGILPENLQKVFQPYFTTKSEGTGLGLAIICELVGNSHGAIHVQSTVGQGTTFTVYLPQTA